MVEHATANSQADVELSLNLLEPISDTASVASTGIPSAPILQFNNIVHVAQVSTPPDSLDSPIAYEQATGRVSRGFGLNVNPTLRGLQQSGAEAFAEPTQSGYQQLGQTLGAYAYLADDIVTMGRFTDLNPLDIAEQLLEAQVYTMDVLQTVTPQNPLIVTDDPESIANASNMLAALFGDVVVVSTPPELSATGQMPPEFGMMTVGIFDIDGVTAQSYGQNLIEVEVETAGGDTQRATVFTPADLEGTIVEINGLVPGLELESGAQLEVVVEDANGTQRAELLPVHRRYTDLLDNGTIQGFQSLSGLTARNFPEGGLAAQQQFGLDRAVSDQVFRTSWANNTFGTFGPGPDADYQPAALTSAMQRSIPPEEGWESYLSSTFSGGSHSWHHITGGSETSPFGLTPDNVDALSGLGNALQPFIGVLAERYNLSDGAEQAFRQGIFTNPDIPSIIIPEPVIHEFDLSSQEGVERFQSMQNDIEEFATSYLANTGLDSVIDLHHTPSIGDDEMALAEVGADKFTGEWQFAMKGRKALPVVDYAARILSEYYNVDLMGELAAKGITWVELREMSGEEVIEALKEVADTLKEAQPWVQLPRIAVGLDTYTESEGELKGSDVFLAAASAAVFGEDNTIILQSDTAGGLPTPGRPKAFEVGYTAEGEPVLTRQSVDPNGENAAFAPTVYFPDGASVLGEVVATALQNQLPIGDLPGDVFRIPNGSADGQMALQPNGSQLGSSVTLQPSGLAMPPQTLPLQESIDTASTRAADAQATESFTVTSLVSGESLTVDVPQDMVQSNPQLVAQFLDYVEVGALQPDQFDSFVAITEEMPGTLLQFDQTRANVLATQSDDLASQASQQRRLQIDALRSEIAAVQNQTPAPVVVPTPQATVSVPDAPDPSVNTVNTVIRVPADQLNQFQTALAEFNPSLWAELNTAMQTEAQSDGNVLVRVADTANGGVLLSLMNQASGGIGGQASAALNLPAGASAEFSTAFQGAQQALRTGQTLPAALESMGTPLPTLTIPPAALAQPLPVMSQPVLVPLPLPSLPPTPLPPSLPPS